MFNFIESLLKSQSTKSVGKIIAQNIYKPCHTRMAACACMRACVCMCLCVCACACVHLRTRQATYALQKPHYIATVPFACLCKYNFKELHSTFYCTIIIMHFYH